MPKATEPPPSEPAVPRCPPLVEPGLSLADAATMAATFKALSDPARVLLFSRVASHPGGEACVCDLGDVGVSQPTVSHHLKKLREAGLLTSERRGTWVYYRVAPGVLAAMGAMLAEAEDGAIGHGASRGAEAGTSARGRGRGAGRPASRAAATATAIAAAAAATTPKAVPATAPGPVPAVDPPRTRTRR